MSHSFYLTHPRQSTKEEVDSNPQNKKDARNRPLLLHEISESIHSHPSQQSR